MKRTSNNQEPLGIWTREILVDNAYHRGGSVPRSSCLIESSWIELFSYLGDGMDVFMMKDISIYWEIGAFFESLHRWNRLMGLWRTMFSLDWGNWKESRDTRATRLRLVRTFRHCTFQKIWKFATTNPNDNSTALTPTTKSSIPRDGFPSYCHHPVRRWLCQRCDSPSPKGTTNSKKKNPPCWSEIWKE